MAEQEDNWVELPNGLDDLNLSDEDAEKVKGGAFDAFIKLNGTQTYINTSTAPSSFLSSSSLNFYK